MRGPFLPLYGSGAIMMLVVSMPFQDNLVLVYIAGCIGATVLEYVTGVTMEALFKVRYWDYSKNKFNFQGHICLGSSLAWGGLTILMTEFIHKPIEHLVLSIPDSILTPVTLIGADFALSFKAALDLRDVLEKMEKAKEDMLRIQKRLDVIIAVTSEDLENRREGFSESLAQKKEDLTEGITTRVEDLKSSIEEKLESIRTSSQKSPSQYLDSVKNEVLELKQKYTRSVADRENVSSIRDFFQRDMIRSNPTMSSEKFKEALEELKEHSNKKNK